MDSLSISSAGLVQSGLWLTSLVCADDIWTLTCPSEDPGPSSRLRGSGKWSRLSAGIGGKGRRRRPNNPAVPKSGSPHAESSPRFPMVKSRLLQVAGVRRVSQSPRTACRSPSTRLDGRTLSKQFQLWSDPSDEASARRVCCWGYLLFCDMPFFHFGCGVTIGGPIRVRRRPRYQLVCEVCLLRDLILGRLCTEH